MRDAAGTAVGGSGVPVPFRRSASGFVFALLMPGLAAQPASAGPDFEEASINYRTAPIHDPVTRLQKRIDAGEVTLEYEAAHGYLRTALKHLKVPIGSQMLVFSKTSFQLQRIGPRTPRALYFSDEIYVGWVQGGDVIEVMDFDPRQGAIFYTLNQQPTDRPQFVRHVDACLQCHASSLTRGVPGPLVRSVVPDADGMPILKAGTFRIDHRSPLKERWGGWYVTGTHGKLRHMGNVFSRDKNDATPLDTEAGANVTDLSGRVETGPYLTGSSDIVALMVMEHQVHLHNLMTFANYQTRTAMRNQKLINDMLEKPNDALSPSTKAQLQYAGEPLVKYMLFVDEAELHGPIRGVSGFARAFTKRGPRDHRGRSLRDLDLTERLLKYPCSYLIYSETFDGLPKPMKDYVYRRLWEILAGRDESSDFLHLSRADRRAIREILLETKPGLPAYWKSGERPRAKG